MSNSKSDVLFYTIVAGIFICVVAVTALGAAHVQENRDFSLWSKGYCAAIGGTSVTDEVCNVDGKVVTIPREEFGR